MEDESGRSAAVLQKQVEVDGEVYKIISLPPSRAFKMGIKLTKMIAEPLANMAAAAKDDSRLEDLLPAAMKAMVSNCDENELLEMLKALTGSGCLSFKNKDVVFDMHFHGRMGHLMRLSGHIVEFQFKDFFEAIVQAVKAIMERVQ